MAHYSVLLQEAIDGLELQPRDIVIDGTVGGGGHTEAIAKRLSRDGILVGLDLDQSALERAKTRLAAETLFPTIYFVNENFRNLDAVIQRLRISAPRKILLDLGWSRNQIEAGGRGFSFQKDEPLRMTYRVHPKASDITAEMIVNEWKEETIADILYGYGEEQFARRIAKAIVQNRERHPIETTRELVSIIERSVPTWYQKRRIHPATKSFQALRIVVNDELNALTEGLEKGIASLAPEGRIAVISFHSSEDRIVKNAFRKAAEEGLGRVVTKKPIIPNREETLANPASRSAKLRIFEKV